MSVDNFSTQICGTCLRPPKTFFNVHIYPNYKKYLTIVPFELPYGDLHLKKYFHHPFEK